MVNKKQTQADATICAAGHPDRTHGAVATPIYQTSTFAFENTEQVAAFARGESDRYQYTRYGNPTIEAAEEKLAALEGGAHARHGRGGELQDARSRRRRGPPARLLTRRRTKGEGPGGRRGDRVGWLAG